MDSTQRGPAEKSIGTRRPNLERLFSALPVATMLAVAAVLDPSQVEHAIMLVWLLRGQEPRDPSCGGCAEVATSAR